MLGKWPMRKVVCACTCTVSSATSATSASAIRIPRRQSRRPTFNFIVHFPETSRELRGNWQARQQFPRQKDTNGCLRMLSEMILCRGLHSGHNSSGYRCILAKSLFLSASGHERTLLHAHAMSASPPIADIGLVGPPGYIRLMAPLRGQLLLCTRLIERRQCRLDIHASVGFRINVLKPVHQRDIFGTQFFF